MRIVGGAWRGRGLKAPAGRATRPTSDKVREAIFDVLATMLEPVGSTPLGEDGALPGVEAEAGEGRIEPIRSGAEAGWEGIGREPRPSAAPAEGVSPFAGHLVLDLYAGSGALGLEALSRGAARCTFVERDPVALAGLRANLAALAVPASAGLVVAADVRRALHADARRGGRYTLVLADPPYATFARVQGDLGRRLGPVLAPRAVIVVETSRREDVRLPWRMERVKRYGDTQVSFLVAPAGEAADDQPAREESEGD